jgi:hypothetical protein
MKRVKELKDPTRNAEYNRFQATLAIFEKYGKQYDFDPLMLAAQGYQESQLDQNAKSHIGAIGVKTTTYVRNIYKYYVTHKLTLDAEATHRKAIESVTPNAAG